MANVVGQGVIVIGADASGFNKDLEKQTSKSAKDTGDRYGTVMGGALKAAAVGIGLAAGATIGVGLSTAMNTEVANMKFTQLFKGQTDKAQGFISDLKAFAARTPFDFPGLQDSAGRFLAVGIEASRVIPIMTTLGDATSIMGTGSEGINRATTALTQMAQKGRVTGEEILQLTEAGIPALDALAASMGKPVPEVQKLIEKGLVPADAMFEALEKSSGAALGSMSGGMEKMSKTTTGKLSTLKDDFSQLAGTIVEKALPAVNWLVDAGENLVKFFSENDAAAKALQVTIGVVAGAFVAHYVAIGVSAVAMAAKNAAAWLVVAVSGNAAGAATKLTIGQMLVHWAALGVQAMIHAVRIAAAWLIAMGPIGLIIAAVIGLVAIIIANLDTIKSWISTAWDWVAEKTYEIWNGIWTFFEGIWESITSTITDAVDNVKSWLSTAWDWIREMAAEAWDKIKWVIAGPIVALVALIIANWDTIKAALAAAWQWIQDVAEIVWYEIQRFFAERWNTIKQVFIDAVDAVKKFLSDGWETIRRNVTGAWESIERVFTDVFDRIKHAFSTTVDIIGEVWNRLKEVAKAPVRFIVDTVINNGLINGINTVAEWLGLGGSVHVNHVPLPAGFATGGWTGPGSASDPAGIVHAGEYVIRKAATDKLMRNAPWLLPGLNQYAAGGRVAPVPGRHSGWGSYSGHTGLDYPVPIGTSVAAFLDGIVDSVRSLATSYGTHVVLGHAGGIQSIYAHLSRAVVSIGQTVTAGQQIGLSGSTGNSTGPHLHFELRQNGRAFDPSGMLAGAEAPGGGGGVIQFLKERVVNFFRDNLNGLLDRIPGASGPFRDVMVGGAKKMIDTAADFFIGKAAASDLAAAGTIGSGSGAQQWADVARQALTLAGQSQSLLPLLLHRIQVESGGNPRAINNWDSNAAAGHPSQGLMQTIPSTFAAYAGALRGRGITDPLANIYAAIMYTADRYRGNFGRAWAGTTGYASGTSSAVPGWGLVGEKGPEWMRFRGGETVLPNGQTPTGGGIVVNMNVSVDDLSKMSKVGDFLTMLDRARLEARRTARSGAVA